MKLQNPKDVLHMMVLIHWCDINTLCFAPQVKGIGKLLLWLNYLSVAGVANTFKTWLDTWGLINCVRGVYFALNIFLAYLRPLCCEKLLFSILFLFSCFVILYCLGLTCLWVRWVWVPSVYHSEYLDIWFSIRRLNFISWGVAGVILEKRDM